MGLPLGDTRYRPALGILDYSKKDTDAFGRTYLNQGSFAKTVEAEVYIKNYLVDRVNTRLTQLRGQAAVWIGDNGAGYGALLVYGFFTDYSIIMQGPNDSVYRIAIEGLI